MTRNWCVLRRRSEQRESGDAKRTNDEMTATKMTPKNGEDAVDRGWGEMRWTKQRKREWNRRLSVIIRITISRTASLVNCRKPLRTQRRRVILRNWRASSNTERFHRKTGTEKARVMSDCGVSSWRRCRIRPLLRAHCTKCLIQGPMTRNTMDCRKWISSQRREDRMDAIKMRIIRRTGTIKSPRGNP